MPRSVRGGVPTVAVLQPVQLSARWARLFSRGREVVRSRWEPAIVACASASTSTHSLSLSPLSFSRRSRYPAPRNLRLPNDFQIGSGRLSGFFRTLDDRPAARFSGHVSRNRRPQFLAAAPGNISKRPCPPQLRRASRSILHCADVASASLFPGEFFANSTAIIQLRFRRGDIILPGLSLL